MTNESEPHDPDIEKVLEVLQAAKRGRHDPDAELAAMLSELALSDGQDTQLVLKRLAGDVDSDSH